MERAGTEERLTGRGREGIPNNALYLINKTIVDDRPNNGVFLFVKEGNPKIKAVNNLLPGKGSFDGH